jgi:hypothetical protein
MAKRVKTIDEPLSNHDRAIKFAEEQLRYYRDSELVEDLTGEELKTYSYTAYMAGAESIEGKKKFMSTEKPKPHTPVICWNERGEVVIGYYDTKAGGMRIYGYEIYGYEKPSDWGLVNEWRNV